MGSVRLSNLPKVMETLNDELDLNPHKCVSGAQAPDPSPLKYQNRWEFRRSAFESCVFPGNCVSLHLYFSKYLLVFPHLGHCSIDKRWIWGNFAFKAAFFGPSIPLAIWENRWTSSPQIVLNAKTEHRSQKSWDIIIKMLKPQLIVVIYILLY